MKRRQLLQNEIRLNKKIKMHAKRNTESVSYIQKRILYSVS